MATAFVKNQIVKVNSVVPQGPVEKLRMDEDGIVWYRITWTDVEGNSQQRWFKEEDLVAVE